MRWKLLIIAASLAALVGAGACLAVARYVFDVTLWLALADWRAAVFLLPLAATTYAAVFVYRRTARRRALQAALVALVSLALIAAALFAAARRGA